MMRDARGVLLTAFGVVALLTHPWAALFVILFAARVHAYGRHLRAEHRERQVLEKRARARADEQTDSGCEQAGCGSEQADCGSDTDTFVVVDYDSDYQQI